MSLTHQQGATLSRRLTKWSSALVKEIEKHGVPNTFGVVEIAGEYNLSKKDGYALNPNKGRFPELVTWVNARLPLAEEVEMEYKRGRFYVKKAEKKP